MGTIRILSQIDKAKCLRRLGHLLEQGYSLMQALDILSLSSTNKERYWLGKISTTLEDGRSIEEAFAEAGFSEFVVLMVAQAEVHGQLADALGKASEWKQKKIQLLHEVRKALAYPCALLVVAGIIFYLIMHLIMPQFQILFGTFDLNLPRSTEFVLSLFQWFSRSGSFLVLILLLVGLLILWGWHKQEVRKRTLQMGLQIPGVRKILQTFYSVMFSVQIGYLLQAKVPLHQSIQKILLQSSSSLFTQKMSTVEQKILQGLSLGEAIQGENLFTAELYPVVYYAERNGQLAEQLIQYGITLEKESIDEWIGRIKWMEPMFLLCMGGLIAYLFLALFAPIIQLIEVL